MCGRVAVKPPSGADRWRFKMERSETEHARVRFNLAPTQETWIVRTVDGVRVANMARWGFIPSWRRVGDEGPEPINARSESVGTSRLFAPALRRQRCIVPVVGYYEWQVVPGRRAKRPYFIHPATGDSFGLAGLWSRWAPPDAEPVETFTILTCAPNDAVAKIHDRMPVILPDASFDAWLDPKLDEVATAAAMLRPAPPESVAAYEVSTHVNSPRNDDAQCIERVTDAGAA